MSLINQMLMDLERRDAPQQVSRRWNRVSAEIPPGQRVPIYVAAVLAVTVLVLGGGWLLTGGGSETAGSVDRLQPVVVDLPLPEARYMQADVKPKAVVDDAGRPVTGLTHSSILHEPVVSSVATGDSPVTLATWGIVTSHGRASLELPLSGSAPYRVDRKEGRIDIFLEGVALRNRLPALPLDATMVRGLHAVSRPGGLMIEVHVVEPAVSQVTAAPASTGGEFVLVLEIDQPEMIPVSVPDIVAESGPPGGQSRVEPARPPAIGTEYAEAIELAVSGRHSEAESGLREVLDRDPGHVLARERLSKLLVEAGRMTEAESILDAGLARAPGHVPFLGLLARVRVHNGALESAIQLLESGLQSAASDPGYWAFLAALYQRAGESAKASHWYGKALDQQPGQAVWWMGLGIALERQNRFESALQAFERAASIGAIPVNLSRYIRQRIEALNAVVEYPRVR